MRRFTSIIFLCLILSACGNPLASKRTTATPTAIPDSHVAMENTGGGGYVGNGTLSVSTGDEQKVVLAILPTNPVQKTTTDEGLKNVVAIGAFVTNTGTRDTSVGSLVVRFSDGTETERQSSVLHPDPAVTSPQADTLTPGGKTNLSLYVDRPKGETISWIRYSVTSPAGRRSVFFDIS
jgi:hypothetical protein